MIDATGGEEDKQKEMNGGQCPFHKKTGSLTNEEVVGNARLVLLAGYETTANTLAYTSYLLAINPDIQEKLQSEIDSYFDDKPVRLKSSISLFADSWNIFIYRMRQHMRPVKRLPTWTM